MSPVVPLLEVVLVGGALGAISVDTAVVVVELDPDGVNIDRTVEDVLVSLVGVRTLGCSSQEEVLATLVGLNQGPELVGESSHVLDIGLEVEVESVQGRVTEGTKSIGAFLLGTKGLPHQLGAVFGIGLRLEAAFAVCGATNGEKNCLALFLAGRDVLARSYQWTGVLPVVPTKLTQSWGSSSAAFPQTPGNLRCSLRSRSRVHLQGH